MKIAKNRDSIALQYANGFKEVLGFGVEFLRTTAAVSEEFLDSVVLLHLGFMARMPDTLIARKRGTGEALQSSRMANAVLEAGGLRTTTGRRLVQQLDEWLRAEGHSRNPGTSADLVAATLFAALRDNRICLSEIQRTVPVLKESNFSWRTRREE